MTADEIGVLHKGLADMRKDLADMRKEASDDHKALRAEVLDALEAGRTEAREDRRELWKSLTEDRVQAAGYARAVENQVTTVASLNEAVNSRVTHREFDLGTAVFVTRGQLIMYLSAGITGGVSILEIGRLMLTG